MIVALVPVCACIGRPSSVHSHQTGVVGRDRPALLQWQGYRGQPDKEEAKREGCGTRDGRTIVAAKTRMDKHR